MREHGQIIRIENRLAVVKLNSLGGCPSCAHAGICTVSGTAHRELKLPFGAMDLKAGDLVEIATPARSLLSAALMIFILPLILAAAGFALVYRQTASNGWATLGFFAAFASAEGLVALYDRIIGRNKFYEPRIVCRTE